MKVQCIIIDDERNARENLASLIQNYCKHLHLIGMASSAEEGFQMVVDLKPDAVFLDIHMPDADGFSLLAKLPKPRPAIVFATAFEHYALKALRASAVDYLLKPISIKELQSAEDKLLQISKMKKENPHFVTDYDGALSLLSTSIKEENPQKIALNNYHGYRFEEVRGIIRLESDSNYTTIHLRNGEKTVASKPLKHFEDILDPKLFLRIHNSHIINLDFLQSYSREEGGYVELADGCKISISKRRLSLFLEMIKGRFIKP